MNELYDSVVHSFFCYMCMTDESSESIRVELAIVEKAGKYGLVQVHQLLLENTDDSCYHEELIIPCVFENLYYPEIAGVSCLFVVQDGKHGVLSMKAIKVMEGAELVIKEWIPCRYDQIHYNYDCPAAFLMRRKGKEYYYDLYYDEISKPYDLVQCLYPNILACWEWKRQIIINLNDEAEFYQPEDGWRYQYACRYKEGCIFRITKEEATLKPAPVRLGFYSETKRSFYCTEIFEQAKIIAADIGQGTFCVAKIEVLVDGKWIDYNEIKSSPICMKDRGAT